MTAFLLHIFSAVFCAVGLLGCLYVLALAMQDNHRRGMARIHQHGPSWSARIPQQRNHR